MKAKTLIAAFLLLATAAPTLAQGNGNGNGGQSDNGNNGNGNGNENESASSNGNSGNGANGNAGGGNSGTGNDNGAGANNGQATQTVIPEEDLLSMVQSGQAVSLASLLPSVWERTGGQIIDAEMVRNEGALIYVVKVLTPDGRVAVEYYNARSGMHIEAQ